MWVRRVCRSQASGRSLPHLSSFSVRGPLSQGEKQMKAILIAVVAETLTVVSAVRAQDLTQDTKKAADKTVDVTKDTSKDVAHGTKKAATKTAHVTKDASKDVAHGTTKAAKTTGKAVDKGATKTVDAVK